jgi:hypothetical protein
LWQFRYPFIVSFFSGVLLRIDIFVAAPEKIGAVLLKNLIKSADLQNGKTTY